MPKQKFVWADGHHHDGVAYRRGEPVPEGIDDQAIGHLKRLRVIVAAPETPAPKLPRLRETKPAALAGQSQQPAKEEGHHDN